MLDFFKHKKRRLLWILAGVMVVAVVGAAGVWFLYLQPTHKSDTATRPPSSLHKASFQALWPLSGIEVPLSGRMGERALRLSFSFVLDSESLVAEMDRHREEIIDAMKRALDGRSVEEMERSGSKVRLKYYTLRLVNGLLGGRRVKGVYIIEFLIL